MVCATVHAGRGPGVLCVCDVVWCVSARVHVCVCVCVCLCTSLCMYILVDVCYFFFCTCSLYLVLRDGYWLCVHCQHTLDCSLWTVDEELWIPWFIITHWAWSTECIYIYYQSLEFVMETRILAEMKMENLGKIYFPWKKMDKHTFFAMKIKLMDLWMQIEGTKLIFVMDFSVVGFFKFASRMPQIAQILILTFKHAPTPLWKFPLFLH